MRFGIVGSGPIGSILGGYLAHSGHEVYLVDPWQDHLNALVEDGVNIVGHRKLHARVQGGFAKVSGLANVLPEVVFICVKAYLLRRLLPEVAACTSPQTVLVSANNGLDTEDVIKGGFPGHRVLRMVINYAGAVAKPGVINMTFFKAPNHLGCACQFPDCGHAQELAELLTQADLETRAESDIKRFAWEKTILNASISPVCALTGLSMQAAMQLRSTLGLIESALAECIAVAARSGYDFGPGFSEQALDYLEHGGPHKPSMRVDIENQRETEVDFMNGRIAYYGALAGVPCPLNETFTRLIKGLEHTYLRQAAGVSA